MGKFTDLLPGSGHPAEEQQEAYRRLPFVLSQSPLHYWSPEEEVYAQGTRFLVGVATWSHYDLKLLDALDKALAKGKSKDRVDVFNIDNCRTMEDLERYIPEAGKMYQTPMVAEWRDGVKIQQACGYAGIEILIKHFGLKYSIR
jgi:hypothetical protein